MKTKRMNCKQQKMKVIVLGYLKLSFLREDYNYERDGMV